MDEYNGKHGVLWVKFPVKITLLKTFFQLWKERKNVIVIFNGKLGYVQLLLTKFNKFNCFFTAPFSTASCCLSLQHLYTFLCFLFPPLPLLVAFLFIPTEPALLPSSNHKKRSCFEPLLWVIVLSYCERVWMNCW